MKKILSLSKVMLKSSFGAQFNDKKELTKGRKILRIIGMGIFGVYLVGITFFMTQSTIEQLVAINQESLLIYTSLSGLSIYLFVTLLMSIPTILYFADDIDSLLPMPLTPRQILSAKLFTIYMMGLISLSFLYLPLGFNYFWQVDRSVFFLINYVIVGLLLPIIPMMISSLFIVCLFSFIPKVNNKDAFTYVTSIFAFVLIFYFSFSSGMNGEQGAWVATIVSSDGPLINSISNLIPNITMYARFITQGNLLLGLLGLSISLVIFLATLFIMEKIYFKGLLATGEVGKSKKKIKHSTLKKQSRTRTPFKALFNADMRNIFRTPALAINYLVVLIIFPVSIAIPLGIGFTKEAGTGEVLMILEFIQEYLRGIEPMLVLMGTVVISFTLSYFMSSMSTIASTSFTREGENMLHYQVFPINLVEYMHVKMVVANIVTVIPGVIISFAILFILKLNPVLYVVSLFANLLATNLSTLEGILTDTLAPKLVWEDVTQALKQNFTSVIPVFTTFIVLGGLGFVLFKNPSVITAAILMLVVIIIEIVLYLLISKKTIFKLEKAIEAI
ncbi:hypothetical protein ERUR111494_01410 [Erysipelothrix urinaevulpis]|uniref:hypothetical protein n=1 Tax=Erysipelothrix urinaevulpis TaxID=2683717 RepID=UPI00135AF50B|nr:hypothetical protein [Erysipelothrix urinaevulpis]